MSVTFGYTDSNNSTGFVTKLSKSGIIFSEITRRNDNGFFPHNKCNIATIFNNIIHLILLHMFEQERSKETIQILERVLIIAI